MKDLLANRFRLDRPKVRPSPWVRSLGEYQPPVFFSPTEEGTKSPGMELISVAQATLAWWEKHKNDTVTVDGLVNYRYEFKPHFVTHAQEVVRKAEQPGEWH